MHSEPSQTANTEFSTNLILSGELELNLGSIKLVHSTLFSDSPSKIYDSCNFSIVKKKNDFCDISKWFVLCKWKTNSSEFCSRHLDSPVPNRGNFKFRFLENFTARIILLWLLSSLLKAFYQATAPLLLRFLPIINKLAV